MVILVMGVAGSGKTTIGLELARDLKWTFIDADDVHPPANIQKMAAGQPLTDEDRAPWLAALRARIDECLAREENAIVTCSALKERYRAALIGDPSKVKVVFLHGSPELLRSRISGRAGHFMPPALLASQLAALEPPSNALQLDVSRSPAELITTIREALRI